MTFARNKHFRKFCAYGFLKNLLFFEPFLILFLRDAGLNYTQIGLLISFQLITQNIILAALALSLPVMIGYSNEQRSALVVGIVYFFIYQATSYATRKSSAFSKRTVNLQQALTISLWTGLLAGIISGIAYYAGYPAMAVAFYVIIYLIKNLRKPIAISETANQLDRDILATVLSSLKHYSQHSFRPCWALLPTILDWESPSLQFRYLC